MEIIIDRFQDRFAVCEVTISSDEQFFVRIPRALLPNSAKEGAVLFFQNGSWSLDCEREAKQLNEVRKLKQKLFI